MQTGALGDRWSWLIDQADLPLRRVADVVGAEMRSRLANLLARDQIDLCRDLAGKSMRDLGDIKGFGAGAGQDLVEWLSAVDGALAQGVVITPVDAGVGPTDPLSEREPTVEAFQRSFDDFAQVWPHLDLVADWAQSRGGERTLRGILASLDAAEEIPVDVADSVRHLSGWTLPGKATEASALLQTWLAGLSDRDADIVMGRVLGVETLETIGTRHGVTRERVRQVERQLLTRLGEQVDEPGWAPVRWAISDLQHRVGSWAPPGVGVVSDGPEPWERLLMHLSDVCILDGGALARDGFSPPDVDGLPREGPEFVILEEPAAARALSEAGVRSEHHAALLGQIGFRPFEGRWIVWPRSFVERAVGILAVRGAPMHTEVLADLTGSTSARSLRQRLAEDPRVQRVTKDEVGLVRWGMPAYTTVADLMLKTVDALGGHPLLADVAAHLLSSHGIRRGTVQAVACAPAFVTEGGRIRARGRGEPYAVNSDVRDVPDLELLPKGRIAWSLLVDRDIARGSGRTMPEPLAGHLDLEPGRSFRYAATVGGDAAPCADLLLSWTRTSHVGPSIGSVKKIVDALRLGLGERLRLTFDPAQETVHGEPATARAGEAAPRSLGSPTPGGSTV